MKTGSVLTGNLGPLNHFSSYILLSFLNYYLQVIKLAAYHEKKQQHSPPCHFQTLNRFYPNLNISIIFLSLIQCFLQWLCFPVCDAIKNFKYLALSCLHLLLDNLLSDGNESGTLFSNFSVFFCLLFEVVFPSPCGNLF